MNSFEPKNRSFGAPDDKKAHSGFENGFDNDFDDEFDAPAAAAHSERPAPAPVQRKAKPADDDWFGKDSSSAAYATAEPKPLVFDTAETGTKTKSPLLSVLPAVILAVMCVFSSLLVPSGDLFVSTDSISDELSASLDMKIGFDNLMSNVLNAAHGLPPVYSLPMTDSPASKPIEENYASYVDDEGIVHSTYEDETISVDCWRKRYYVNDVSSMVSISKVKITHPTQLRTAFAGGQYSSKRLLPSVISKQVNAVVSINGELYNYAGKTSVLVRQGTVYRDDIYISDDILFIDSHGDFHVMTARDAVSLDILHNSDYDIYQSVCFGPALVIKGEVVNWGGKTDNSYARNPRSAIGQIGPLEYLLVAAEGRAENSKGLTAGDLAVLMRDLGCTEAYNLDGGQSSMMIFHNKPYNSISNGSERTFSDIIYFGSALPEE